MNMAATSHNFAAHGLHYRIERSGRHTAEIVVERDGSVSVKAPTDASVAAIERALVTKLDWIRRSQAQIALLTAEKTFKSYVSGESFAVLGRNVRLKVVDTAAAGSRRALVLDEDRFYLRRDAVQRAPEHFKRFYRELGHERLPERMSRLAGILGVEPTGLGVMELGNRWGSCSSSGHLHVHWKVMMAPLNVIDYVLAHELAHLVNRDHSKEFWALVRRAVYDYENQLRWLRRHGAGMEL
jgi:predicted metal-dependent hydrolase